jgi:hypothetical protein
MKSKNTKVRELVNFWQDEWQRSLDLQRASAEMKLLRKTAGCTLSDHNRNELTTEEIKTTPTAEYLQQYSRKWLQHINRMKRSRISRQVLYNVPKGKRSQKRLSKKWQGTVTGH